MRREIRKINDVLGVQLHGGLSHEPIARSPSVFKGVVPKYTALARAAGLSRWDAVEPLGLADLERRLFGSSPEQRRVAQADFAREHAELRRKGMTLTLLSEEYRAAHKSQRTWSFLHVFTQCSQCSPGRRFDPHRGGLVRPGDDGERPKFHSQLEYTPFVFDRRLDLAAMTHEQRLASEAFNESNDEVAESSRSHWATWPVGRPGHLKRPNVRFLLGNLGLANVGQGSAAGVHEIGLVAADLSVDPAHGTAGDHVRRVRPSTVGHDQKVPGIAASH